MSARLANAALFAFAVTSLANVFRSWQHGWPARVAAIAVAVLALAAFVVAPRSR
jgi:hypothetical protein